MLTGNQVKRESLKSVKTKIELNFLRRRLEEAKAEYDAAENLFNEVTDPVGIELAIIDMLSATNKMNTIIIVAKSLGWEGENY